MAKTARKKTARVSSRVQNIADKQRLGDEPFFQPGHTLTPIELMRALNWYSYMCDVSDARKFLKDPRLKPVKDNFFPLTAAWITRIEALGAIVPQSEKVSAQNLIANAIQTVEPVATPEKASVVDRTIQDRVKARAREHIAEFEAALDARSPDFSAYGYLEAHKVPPLMAKQILDYYGPILLEVIAAVKGQDDQLVEAYRKMGRKEVKRLFDYLCEMLKGVERYVGGVKAQKAPRKPRKKRAIDPAKKLKNLKFKSEDQALKVKSVNPIALLGAQEVWTFNAKTKLLAVYRAAGPAGIDIKGTTMLGYDTENSVGKRVGRKAETFIERVLKGGKIVKRKLMDEIKTSAVTLNGRLNADTLILVANK